MANKTVTVKSAGGDYSSLNAALAGESTNLVDTLDGILTIECYNFEDTTPADTGTGYTTDADHYINITVAAGNRHNGKWSTSGYRLDVNNDWFAGLKIQEDYTRTGWLQIDNTTVNTSYGYQELTVNNCRVYNCISKSSHNGFMIRGTSWNDIAYDSIIAGFNLTEWVTETVYNCTAVDCGTGFLRSVGGSCVIKNCLGYSNTTDFAATGATNTTCASDDSTADDFGGSGNVVDIDDPFIDSAGDDFHLSSSNSCIGAGTDDPGTGLFSDDIDGETRSDWDIGADEYIAPAGAVYPPPDIHSISATSGNKNGMGNIDNISTWNRKKFEFKENEKWQEQSSRQSRRRKRLSLHQAKNALYV